MNLPDLLTPDEARALLQGAETPETLLAGRGLGPEEAQALHREADVVLRELDQLSGGLTHPNARKAARQARRAVVQAREWEKHFARREERS